jgi:glycolate oxidase
MGPRGERAVKTLGRDLCRFLDARRILVEPEDLHCYACDATRFFAFHPPDAVILPETTQEISRVLAYAEKQKVPVTPRGAGTGLSAGCTPVDGGIVIDLKRMRRIVEINRGNMTARVEAGVVLADFYRAVEKERMFYPPDPQSMSVCTIGGNVATRAGGPHGVKYGTTPNYVLGLEAVLPGGEIIATGGMCVKQSVGYDLTHLLTGSEGTLAVITRVNLRLIPLPESRRTVIIVCETVELAADLVAAIIGEGVVPAKMEFINKGGVALINVFIPKPLPLTGEGYLLIELHGSPASVVEEAARLEAIAARMGATEVRAPDDEREATRYWEARRNLNPVLQRVFKKVISEDVTVPRDKIPALVRAISKISADSGIMVGLFGHAGDGNMHPTILLPQLGREQEEMADRVIAEIVKAGLALGGCISGEHGIGMHKALFLPLQVGAAQVELMKRVKLAFDPLGIMNPGKIWPRVEQPRV